MSKELVLSLKKEDFTIQTFRAGGKGGQNQNKRDTGVRIIHNASGAVGEARDSRTQKENRRNALKRLSETATFRLWLARYLSELSTGKTLEEQVEELMNPKNIKVEVRGDDGRWKEENGN